MNKPAFEDTSPIEASKPAFEDTEPIDSGSFLTSPAAQQLGQAVTQGPSAMLGAIPGIASYVAGQAGQNVSQQMQQGGMNPDVSNAVGTAVKYSPDVAMLAMNPVGEGPSSLANKVIPPFLKATKGIPPNVTRMVLENPDILKMAGTSEAIQGKSQNIIDAVKEARKIVGTKLGEAYASQGMENPIHQIVNGQNPIKSQINKTSYMSGGTGINTAINPVEQTAILPGSKVSSAEIAGTVPVQQSGKNFNDLRNEYHAALSGDLFKQSNLGGGSVEISNTDKLAKLTDLKRSLQNQAVYPSPGQQLTPEQGAYNAAIKTMASNVDQLRGKFPGGDKLAVADDAWHEITQLNERLRNEFQDPYKGQDYLNRILKGNTDWLTSGRMAGKIGAIERIEQITGKDVLKPALKEMAAAYINNPDVMSLPGFSLTSIITSLIPAKTLLKTPSMGFGLPTLAAAKQVPNVLNSLGLTKEQNNDNK